MTELEQCLKRYDKQGILRVLQRDYILKGFCCGYGCFLHFSVFVAFRLFFLAFLAHKESFHQDGGLPFC